MNERETNDRRAGERIGGFDPRCVLSASIVLLWCTSVVSSIAEETRPTGWLALSVVVLLTLWLATLNYRATGLSPLTRTGHL